jgi:drug/metabolite transporter (DMT)-like permease
MAIIVAYKRLKTKSMQANKEKLLIPALIISMVIWGISWPSAKYLTQFGHVIDIAFTRFVFTVIGIFFILKVIKVPFTISKKGIPLLLLGAALMAGYSLLFFGGVQKGMPGAGGVLVTTLTPIISYTIAMIINKQKPTISVAIGLLLGLIAAIFLLHIWQGGEAILQSGNLFFICSCVVWALLSRITAVAQRYGSALAYTWWMYVVCAAILSVFANHTKVIAMLNAGDAIFWGNLIFNAVINTGIATTIFFFATTQMGSARTSSFIYIVPFAAAISSWIIFNEQIKWYTIVGGAIGLCAVWCLNQAKKNIVNK